MKPLLNVVLCTSKVQTKVVANKILKTISSISLSHFIFITRNDEGYQLPVVSILINPLCTVHRE